MGQQSDSKQRVREPDGSAGGLVDEVSRDDRLWSVGWRLAWIVTPIVAAALLALTGLAAPAWLSLLTLLAGLGMAALLWLLSMVIT